MNHLLVECPEDLGKIGSHVSSSDDVAHILSSSKNNPVPLLISQTVVCPNCQRSFTSLPAASDLLNVSPFQGFYNLRVIKSMKRNCRKLPIVVVIVTQCSNRPTSIRVHQRITFCSQSLPEQHRLPPTRLRNPFGERKGIVRVTTLLSLRLFIIFLKQSV